MPESNGCLRDDGLVCAGYTRTVFYTDYGSMTGSIQLCPYDMPPPEGGAAYRSFAVVVHELGHALRLPHADDAANVMNANPKVSWTIADWQIEQVRDTTHGVEPWK